jgi:hypothetical protein
MHMLEKLEDKDIDTTHDTLIAAIKHQYPRMCQLWVEWNLERVSMLQCPLLNILMLIAPFRKT